MNIDCIVREAFERAYYEPFYRGDAVKPDLDDGIDAIITALKDAGAIIPPCEFGRHLWLIERAHTPNAHVVEYIAKNLRTCGNKHKVRIAAKPLVGPGEKLLTFDEFYLSEEAARRALAKQKNRDLKKEKR